MGEATLQEHHITYSLDFNSYLLLLLSLLLIKAAIVVFHFLLCPFRVLPFPVLPFRFLPPRAQSIPMFCHHSISLILIPPPRKAHSHFHSRLSRVFLIPPPTKFILIPTCIPRLAKTTCVFMSTSIIVKTYNTSLPKSTCYPCTMCSSR